MVSTMQRVESWGRLTKNQHFVSHPAFLDEAHRDMCAAGPETLAFGCGRSYSDVCLNSGGRLFVTALLDHIIEADWAHGIIRAEAGLTLDALLRVAVPRGWFLPTTPGTKFVSLGGAVANDVHGKNHEAAGTFGCHVKRIGLYRSTGECLVLSPDQNAKLFGATIGGLGLTGLIAWIELQLMPIQSAYFEVETLRMRDLDAFFRLSAESAEWPYTIAWVDGLAKKRNAGRGLFIRGRHAADGGFAIHRKPRWTVPFDAKLNLLNHVTIKTFNFVYRNCGMARRQLHYDKFLFPLDGIGHWNLLYGRRGFFQHQSVFPAASGATTISKLLELTAKFEQPAMLAGLKLFGERMSPGILSFPRPGVTLGLDFPNKGEDTRRMLAEMADLVVGMGGRLYPAKDAVMSGKVFRASYPNWTELEQHRDPAIMSDFWRRILRGAA
jgi:FAD/FMN-containing dehydrogenase